MIKNSNIFVSHKRHHFHAGLQLAI